MDYIALLTTFLSLLQANVVVGVKPDQTRCRDLEAKKIGDKLLTETWWVHGITDAFATPVDATDITNQAIQVIFYGEQFSPDTRTTTRANIYVHNDSMTYMRVFTTDFVRTDPKYAVFTSLVVGVAIHNEGGTYSRVPSEEAFPSESSRRIPESAIVYADERLIIFVTCDKRDFMVLVSDSIAKSNRENNYDKSIIKTLQGYGIPINKNNAAGYAVDRKFIPIEAATNGNEVPYVSRD